MIPPHRFLKIKPEDRKEGTIGKETMSNIGEFIQDQYERIPEDKRQGFEQGVSEAATGIQEWNKQLREENYHGGIGPLDPFIAAGKAYNFVAEPIKKELSIQTGLAPSVIEAGEVAADFLLPAIPLTGVSKGKKISKSFTAKRYKSIIEDVYSKNMLETHNRHKTITRFSTLDKQTNNKNILDQYIFNKAQDGPYKSWEGQDVPFGEVKGSSITEETYDIAKKYDFQGNELRQGKVKKSTLTEKQAIYEGAPITNVEELDRVAAALVQRRTGTMSGIEFNKWTEEATADLKKAYRHITTGELNAHHNNIVKSGVSLHEGRSGAESMIIESWLINKGVHSGNSPLNNNLIPTQVHSLVHKWMNERIGNKYLTGLIGELNSPLRKRWESLPIDHPDVRRVVEQYADYVNGATERTAELMQAYYKIWGPESQITEEALDVILKKLNITELEYSQLVKPGLSGKDARAFAQGYGPKKIEVTWADGVTETMYERLSREINDDPLFAAQLDELNAKQVKVGDFSNEPTSPTPAQIRRQGWAKEIEDLEYEKKVGKLSKNEKKRLEELRKLMFYGEGLPLLRGIRYGGGPFKEVTKTLEGQTTKIKGTRRLKDNSTQKSLFDQISDIIDHKE